MGRYEEWLKEQEQAKVQEQKEVQAEAARAVEAEKNEQGHWWSNGGEWTHHHCWEWPRQIHGNKHQRCGSCCEYNCSAPNPALMSQ